MRNIFFTIALLWGTAMVSEAQVASIPFELVENSSVLIKLRMNNCPDSLIFYFDTGAETTLIDSRCADKIGLVPNYEQQVDGAGGKEVYKIALSQQVRVSDQLLIDGTHIVLSDLSRLQAAMGRKFDGIIGASVLNRYVTKVDFDKRVIELYEFDTKLNVAGFTELPIFFNHGIRVPQLPISITLKNGESFTDTVFFDSGANLSLLVNSPYKLKHKINEKVGQTIVTENNNLSTTSIQEEGMIGCLQLGNYKFGENIISLSSDSKGVSSYDGYLGILGNRIINRFNFITDYSAKKIYLTPNTLFDMPFEMPVSGLKLKLVDGQVVVASVVGKSPAFKKGIRAEDKIIAINGIRTASLATYRQLLKQEDSTVDIQFEDSKGKLHNLKLRLKRII